MTKQQCPKLDAALEQLNKVSFGELPKIPLGIALAGALLPFAVTNSCKYTIQH